MNEQTASMATEPDGLPLEVKGLELLSDGGLKELLQYVEQEILRRRARVEISK